MNDRKNVSLDLDRLLRPAQAFGRPSQIVNDPDLTLNEKGAILTSWASDACAVEAEPGFRRGLGGPVVRFDDIMDALHALDEQFAKTSAKMRTTRRRTLLDGLRSRNDRSADLN